MNALKRIREENGLTVSELAKKSGITRQTIYRLENEDEESANSKTLKALADALEVQVSDFFAVSGKHVERIAEHVPVAYSA